MNKSFRYLNIIQILVCLSVVPVINARDKQHLDSLYHEFINIKNPATRNSLQQLSIKPFHHKCQFGIAGEIKAYLNLFTPDQQVKLKMVLERPVMQKSIVSPSGKFRIHYDVSGGRIPKYVSGYSPDENAFIVANAIDSSYRFEVDHLKYLPPPGDNGNGGDNLYDIYIVDFGSGINGYTQNDELFGENTFNSFIQIDNDFDGCYTSGINACNITAAHELFHAIQIGNYYYNPLQYGYFYEMNATAMEDFVFDEVNDYYSYKNYFHDPSKPFYEYSDKEAYGLAVWPIFLKEKYGYDIIRRQWELVRNNNPLWAMELSLRESGASFTKALNEFGLWSYYTGKRKQLGMSGSVFEEGEFYPELWMRPVFELTKSEVSFQQSAKSLSNTFYKFVSKMTAGYNDTVISIITNGDVESAINNPGADIYFQYALYTYKAGDTRQISDQLFSKITCDKPQFYTESNIVNNKTHHYIAETESVFPNPFSYKDYESYIYLPVSYNNSFNSAEIKIFTISMNLVYSGKREISQKNDTFIVTWNGLDLNNKKLSTGVYIYVTENDGKLKIGKLVIKNE